MQTVKEYLHKISPEEQAEYQRLRAIVLSIVPDAVEVMSYGLPTLKHKDKPLLYFGAFKNHMSVFPTPEPVLNMQAQGKLTEFKVSKGTVQFTADKPLPKKIIVSMLELRLAAING